MHILTVVAHPRPASFTHAVAAAFARGAAQAGHVVEIADLHAQGFDPLGPSAAQTQGYPPPDIRAERARIDRADGLCLVFPLHWYAMPAMLKGWIDRVWTQAWAFDDIADPPRSLQRPRPGLLLIPAGADPATWATPGLDRAMGVIWRTGTFAHFGLSPLEVTYLGSTEGPPDHRARLLAEAESAGRRFAQDGQASGTAPKRPSTPI